MEVEVRTQAELDAAVKDGHIAVCVAGDLTLTTTGSESPWMILKGSATLRVEAWGSSQPRVEARGSSQPRVVARGSSQPRVEARGSSQPRVEAWESSQPRVEAWGSSQPRVVARESSQPRVVAWGMVQLSIEGAVSVIATALVAIAIHGCGGKVEGGKQTVAPKIEKASQWCEYFGVKVEGEVAIVFKGLNDEYKSPNGGDYTPGTIPAAPDWDGGKEECGGGYHASPHPAMTLSYNSDATKFVACPVLLSDIAVHCPAKYPDKIKFSKCCAPCWEVDIDGERIEAVEKVAAK